MGYKKVKTHRMVGFEGLLINVSNLVQHWIGFAARADDVVDFPPG